MRIYTRRGDDGTTGLFHGGRVTKDAAGPEAYGTVDEAVSALGVARAAASGAVADEILVVQRRLFVVAAELATDPVKGDKLESGVSRVSQPMIDDLEERIDAFVADRGMPTEFVVPGGDPVAAAIDVARSIVRRSERRAVTWQADVGAAGSLVVPYLNRLADYLYMFARSVEGEWTPSRGGPDG
ncbi:MAG: cob(I)yrinic acid a,c-diamide adenosyltransferase [Acidimicrobiia bacterium]|nr:MAG: cob(I)yrinic acid a,c-diamide adenosyltransferase [Acidimicrobiia bacterium]